MELTQVRSEEPLLQQPAPRSRISCFHWLSIASFALLLLATIVLALLHFQIIPSPGSQNQDEFQFADVFHIKTVLESTPQAQALDRQRPAAHLRGKLKGNSIEWKHSTISFFNQDIELKENSLVIPRTGLYLIYTQVVYTGRNCINIKETDLTHKVVQRSNSFDKPHTILSSTKTVCEVQSKSTWTQPIYQGAVFQFTEGDIISTETSHVDLLNPSNGQIYLGILAL
ncbi:tumor necrosis factor [Gastrophryne carolinensis]